MPNSRTDFHALLVEILGSSFVYFQPPATVQMTYPCIVYERSDYDIKHANNIAYAIKKQYKVTFISKSPDSLIPDNLVMLPLSSFDRQYVSDNLYHNIFIIYF